VTKVTDCPPLDGYDTRLYPLTPELSMNKLLLAATLATLSFSAAADGWRVAPLVTDAGFKLSPSLALAANHVDPKDGPSATGYGVDFNFNCGLLQDPQNRMRTHINLGQTKKDGVKVNAFELSPRYTVPLSQALSFGAGPSLAAYKVKADTGYDETLLGLGVAAGINYRAGAFYAGADVRYHDTKKKAGADFPNWTLGLKVGMNF
jgi:hypothetical protein